MATSSLVAAPAVATKLSSSAVLGGAQAQFAPIRNVNVNDGRVVAVTASYSEVSYPSPNMHISLLCFQFFWNACTYLISNP
jgi:hypothetical protein